MQEVTNLRERKKTLKRMEIIQKTVELFEKSSFDAVTMENIAKECDITKATLYKYFPVKESILVAQWQELIKQNKVKIENIATANKTTESRLQALMSLSMRQIMKHRDLYQIYISYRLQYLHDYELTKNLRSGIGEAIYEIIRLGQQEGEIRSDIPIEALIGNFEMLHVMQSMMWLWNPKGFSAPNSSKMLVDLFLHGAQINE